MVVLINYTEKTKRQLTNTNLIFLLVKVNGNIQGCLADNYFNGATPFCLNC